MAQPRDILDSPGKVPGELDPPKRNDDPPADPYADDTKEERAARLAWPELPWTPGEYGFLSPPGCVLVPRVWFSKYEVPDAVIYSVHGSLICAHMPDRPPLVCIDDAPSFEGAYLPSPTSRPRWGS